MFRCSAQPSELVNPGDWCTELRKLAWLKDPSKFKIAQWIFYVNKMWEILYMVSDCTLQLTFKELLLDEFWCSIKDFPKLSVRLLKYFSNICMRPDVFGGLQRKQYTAIGCNWIGDPTAFHERDLPTCQKCHSSHYFFLFWKTVYYKIQFVMTACNGLHCYFNMN